MRKMLFLEEDKEITHPPAGDFPWKGKKEGIIILLTQIWII